MKRRWQLQNELKLEKAEADRIKELDAFKSTFYTNITHEFRTPLTVILGMAQQIKEKPQQFLKEGITLIKRNGKNLLKQINQILDLSKLETNTLQHNLIQGDVVEFLRYSTEAFQSFANGKNLSLRFFSPVESLQMGYDPDLLQNIMSNLLSSALKFTPEGGDVKTTLAVENNQLIIKFIDTGIGIQEKDVAHIFDRFYQAENATTKEHYGTGVGLAYTKALVRLMNGMIDVKSIFGQGTTFIVQLPI
ncbi:MAG: HAMP domain-containing sensor histidine kinase, partial [Bacteroidota bacterium]